jgi:Ca-activated chloride channel family protein
MQDLLHFFSRDSARFTRRHSEGAAGISAPASTPAGGGLGRLAAMAVAVVLGFGCGAEERTGKTTSSDAQETTDRRAKKSVKRGKRSRKKVNRPMPAADMSPRRSHAPTPQGDQEAYEHIEDNAFSLASAQPLSTFSTDTDTASYANLRRVLREGKLPVKGAVRIEEMVNYFTYDYAAPDGQVPFSTSIDVTDCPWADGHLLARIGLKGQTVEPGSRPPANLVFLLDVSGSMGSANKLPLLKRTLKLAVNQLNETDRVAIVVYAGSSGLVLPSTAFDDRQKILSALDRLSAGGSTAGGSGIKLAYKVAKDNFVDGGINRVILATDGDFNVGTTSQSALVDMVQTRAKEDIFLTVLGFGMGNLKDDLLEEISNKGNGNYAYIDSFQEARKVFSQQIGGTLQTIAKDVKIQVEFNPSTVEAYRLIGYENRMLAAQDFNDDTKDAGEIGAGHTVTAIYQVVPKGVKIGFDVPGVDKLKFQKGGSAAGSSGDLMNVKLRYKPPTGDTSTKIEFPVPNQVVPLSSAGADMRFAAAVAGFGMLLRDSKYKGSLSYKQTIALADGARGRDKYGYRAEMVQLARTASSLKR